MAFIKHTQANRNPDGRRGAHMNMHTDWKV